MQPLFSISMGNMADQFIMLVIISGACRCSGARAAGASNRCLLWYIHCSFVSSSFLAASRNLVHTVSISDLLAFLMHPLLSVSSPGQASVEHQSSWQSYLAFETTKSAKNNPNRVRALYERYTRLNLLNSRRLAIDDLTIHIRSFVCPTAVSPTASYRLGAGLSIHTFCECTCRVRPP
jgi:hypothetical protein